MNRHHPPLTVIVPVDDSRRRIWGVDTLLARHVTDSLLRKTTYNNYTVNFVASESLDEAELQSMVSRFEGRATAVRLRGSFSRSQAFNVGLVACTTSHAALVDQHCDFVEGDWIETLFAYMSRDGVAAVAPILTDEYGVIHSAGLSLTPEPHDTASGHRVSEYGPVGMFAIARECFGVRTRCAVVDVAALKSVGGFSPDYVSDLVDFDVACKLHELGKHAIVTPLVTVRLFDEFDFSDDDQKVFASRWGRYVCNDPYTRSDTRARETVEL